MKEIQKSRLDLSQVTLMKKKLVDLQVAVIAPTHPDPTKAESWPSLQQRGHLTAECRAAGDT